MSATAIGEAQAVMARLYTDPEALASYRADPVGFAARHGARTAQLLAGLDLTRLTHYARSLQWKRAREAAHLVPLLAHAMGGQFFKTFLAHATTVAPSGSRRPLADAMAFACVIARDAGQPRVVRDAARFEWHSLDSTFKLRGLTPVVENSRDSIEEMSREFPTSGVRPLHVERRRGVRAALRRFSYELPALDTDRPIASWPLRTTIVLFVGAFGRGRIWYW